MPVGVQGWSEGREVGYKFSRDCHFRGPGCCSFKGWHEKRFQHFSKASFYKAQSRKFDKPIRGGGSLSLLG